jgi:predicted nucleic-acid-binding protein
LGGAIVKIGIDTNVLVRLITVDEPIQARKARRLIADAELVGVSISSLCEAVWVLRSGFGYDRIQIVVALEAVLNTAKFVMDRVAVDAGLRMLREGADFADGVIALESDRLGGESFVSFDRKAISALRKAGKSTELLT